MTNYKQLCAELVNELHGYKVAHPNHDTDLIARARAELAKPEPQASHEELDRRFETWWYNEGSGMPPRAGEDYEELVHRVSRIAWHNGAYCTLTKPEPEDPTDAETMELMPQQIRDDLFRISKCAISIKDSLRSLMIEVDDLLAIAIELEPQ